MFFIFEGEREKNINILMFALINLSIRRKNQVN